MLRKFLEVWVLLCPAKMWNPGYTMDVHSAGLGVSSYPLGVLTRGLDLTWLRKLDFLTEYLGKGRGSGLEGHLRERR